MRVLIWLGVATAALLIVLAVATGLRRPAPRQSARPEAAAKPVPPPAQRSEPVKNAAEQPAQTRPKPSFDIVTVDPHGQAVIAGRAAPGDRVRVLDDGKPIGEAKADARGEFVLLPKQPMPAGNAQLALEATGRDGGPTRRSGDTVALSVTGSRDLSALAVLLPADPAKPVKVLQRPGGPENGAALALDSAEYGSGDRLVLSGHAEPGSRLNIYAGRRLLGTATADPGGKWSLAASQPRDPQGIELRVERLAGGTVAQRVGVLETAAAPSRAGTYVVRRGNNLWLIARRIYGAGTHYTAIYFANRRQIRDPDLIYPGQHFRLPPS